MQKTILLMLGLLVASSTPAAAAGVALRWSACLGDAGTPNRIFACDTNADSHALVGSFVLDAALADVVGNELVVHVTSSTLNVPDWWRYVSSGSCRQLAFTIAAHDGPGCPDPFSGLASMNNANYQIGIFGPDVARLVCVNAVTQMDAADLLAGTEYSIAKWTIRNIKTVGTGSCAGCLTPMSIEFRSANIVTLNNLNNTKLEGGTAPGANQVTWQGAVVPTKRSSWSAVKSLYR